jgi:GDP-L-fucose synthase
LSPDGFVGSAMKRGFDSSLFLLTLSREDLDFRDTESLTHRIRDINPSIVINAAGRVAGIQGNIDNPVDLIMSNTDVTTSVLRASHEAGVSKYIQFASACVYPLNESTPSRPEDLGTGPIEQTSLSYATAKILAIEAVRAYRNQYKHDWLTVIPTNLYGPGDWDHGSGGHVISMLMEKFVSAKDDGSDAVTVWGDGNSRRSFLHIDDLANATQFMLKQSPDDQGVINVSGDQEISIRDLAFLIREVTRFKGGVIFDSTKPNGARRKQLDDSYLRGKGWQASVTLEAGLRDYLQHYLDRAWH